VICMANMQVQLTPTNDAYVRSLNRRKGDMSEVINAALDEYRQSGRGLPPKKPVFSDIIIPTNVQPVSDTAVDSDVNTQIPTPTV
jgi:hypothetical protein